MGTRPTKEQVAEFFQAIHDRDTAKIIQMVQSGMSPDAISAEGISALFAAVLKSDHATAKTLLDAGANPNLAGKRASLAKKFVTPLNFACEKGDRPTVLLLLDHGADLSIASRDGQTPLHYVFWHEKFSWQPTKDWRDYVAHMVDRMLDSGHPVNARDRAGRSVLQMALVHESQLSTFATLLRRGADPRMKKADGTELIHWAANYCRPDVLRLLVEHGVDVNAVDAKGRTPLFYCNKLNAGAALFELGADVDHQDLEGDTALHERMRRELDSFKVSDLAQQLIEAGARADIKNQKGRTALDIARRHRLGAQVAVLTAMAARSAMRRTVTAPRPG